MAKTHFSISFTDDGRLNIGIAGDLTGSRARKILDIVETAVESDRWKVRAELDDLISLDSLGSRVIEWIREKGGEVNQAVISP
ncbi:MAG: hypothetical protein E3J72_17810 [Planctomycetota bacterium]|nr:MAG: hypothetical protein E3J72_17810 [Planctomycetota bacterium]